MVTDLFEDAQVFDDGYYDVELLYRGGEMEEIWERFNSVGPDDMLLTGPSGVGKTLLTRKLLDELEVRRSIHRVHVDCLGKTTAGVLRAVLEDHPNGPREVPQTMSTEKVHRELTSAIDRETVIVLDEGDDLPYTDAIGDLVALDGVTVVAIAHDDVNWLSSLDTTDSHSFDRGHMEITSHSVAELTDILVRRARQGFYRPTTVSDQQLRFIANEVAGVARKGIQWLWGAADIARERDHYRIRDEDIRDGKQRAWRRIRRLNLESLPVHHRVLYAIVHEAGEISGEELHDRYDQVADEVYHNRSPQPIGERARRSKFKKLKRYDLVDYTGPTRDRTYWVVDGEVKPQKIELPATVAS